MEEARAHFVDPSVPPLPPRFEAEHNASHNAALLFLALAIGLTIELCGPSWAQALFKSVQLGDLSGWAALILAAVIAIVLHEAGHLVPALAMNFEILGASVGPVRATHIHGRWSFQFLPRRLFSGSVSAIPRDARNWRMRMLIVVAGGPIATLMTGLLSGLLLCRTGTGTRPGCFFGTLAEISFFLFVLGFFPNSIKARVRNDARLLLLLWSNGIEADEMFLYHIVAQCQCAGLRPRDYPRSLIERLSVASGRPEAIVLYAQLISAWAIDRGDLVTAAAWSQRAEEVSESCDARTRNLARAGVACFGAMFGEDPNISRNKFQGVKLDTLAPEHFRHRAKAAYWLANGNKAEALAEVYRSRLAFPKRLPYYDFEHSLLVHLYRRALSGNVPALTSRT